MFKDLGPQVAYKTLFFFEYLGPLIIYPIFYFYPQIYNFFGLPTRQVTHPVQTYALYAWCFHYAKREFETFFIHRFSHATSPLANVYRNCAYYWVFGALIAYFANHPLYTPVSKEQMYIGFAIAAVSQISNFYCHIILKNLRSPDGKGGYQIPSGFLFNYVTCANYTTEIWQWIGFNIATQTLAGYLFLGAAGYIMSVWALQKHKRLRQVFAGLHPSCFCFGLSIQVFGPQYRRRTYLSNKCTGLRRCGIIYENYLCIVRSISSYKVDQVSGIEFVLLVVLQTFDGKEGRAKYPRRWVIMPPLL